jgi:replicative DNA helicase
MSTAALGLVASLVDSPTGLSDFIRLGLSSELFKGPEESDCWQLLSGYIGKYGTVPNRQRFVDNGIALPLQHADPAEWYADVLKSRHTHVTLKQTVLDVQDALNADKPYDAHQLMTDTVLKLLKTNYKRKLVDFAHEGLDIISKEMKAKKLQGDDYGVKFGWPTLDGMAEGLAGGDVVTIVGRPGKGKTYAMLYTASHAWKKQKKRPMFVSMEMKPLPIVQRLAAMNAKKPITQLKKAELSTAAEKDLFAKLKAYEDENQFWVVDGNLTASVDDIILLARQLKPDVVWIDGAYLVRGGNQQQRWDRVTYVLERVKSDLAEALDLPVVISFQFNRKQKKGAEADLDNIAYSDAVGQLSSVVLGLGLADDEGSVEAIHKRKVEIIKGRNGEVGEFFIHWQFDQGPDFMNFGEIKTIDQGDMVFGIE